MTLVGSLVAGLAATWKHVPEADTVRSSKSRKKMMPNQLGRYYNYQKKQKKNTIPTTLSIPPPPKRYSKTSQ